MQTNDGSDRRRFVRHPIELPVQFTVLDGDDAREPDDASSPEVASSAAGLSHNISFGGIALRVDAKVELGRAVRLQMTSLGEALGLVGRAVWRVQLSKGYDLGVEFGGSEENYRARMIEQICQIEAYRQRRVDAGEVGLDAQTAARDWIAEHGHTFP